MKKTLKNLGGKCRRRKVAETGGDAVEGGGNIMSIKDLDGGEKRRRRRRSLHVVLLPRSARSGLAEPANVTTLAESTDKPIPRKRGQRPQPNEPSRIVGGQRYYLSHGELDLAEYALFKLVFMNNGMLKYRNYKLFLDDPVERKRVWYLCFRIIDNTLLLTVDAIAIQKRSKRVYDWILKTILVHQGVTSEYRENPPEQNSSTPPKGQKS